MNRFTIPDEEQVRTLHDQVVAHDLVNIASTMSAVLEHWPAATLVTWEEGGCYSDQDCMHLLKIQSGETDGDRTTIARLPLGGEMEFEEDGVALFTSRARELTCDEDTDSFSGTIVIAKLHAEMLTMAERVSCPELAEAAQALVPS